MIKKWIGLFLIAGAMFNPIQAVARDTTTDSAGEFLDDATITAKVKAAFAKDKIIKGRLISVRTDKGVVDLTGTVRGTKESDRATDISTKIKSVSAVHNNLKITP